MRKTIPYLKKEYLSESHERKLFEEIQTFVNKYNTSPTPAALNIALKSRTDVTEPELKKATELLVEVVKDKSEHRLEWLVDETEKFCQEKAVYNAIMDSIQILDGNDSSRTKGSIPSILSDALGVSFDPNVGHDYLDNSDSRYDFYHRVEKRIPFGLQYFNAITQGGLPQKTLNIALAGTGVGKSLFMCDFAANCLLSQYNVLYITLEMAEERIAERIDANLLDVTLDDLKMMPKDTFEKRMERLKKKAKGKLIIKEYPTASANAAHFRALLNELELKRNFKPDIIFIDYLNICASARIKAGANVNSYTYVKAIAEELRGLAMERSVPIVSATQTTRSGYNSSDPGLEDTSESFGLPATADFMFALISTEELEKLGQIMVKQLKNRYGDPNKHKRFVVGVNRSKMRLFDLEQTAQDGLSLADVPIATRILQTPGSAVQQKNEKFKGLKI
jgi:KaiC/GvpD/RAD55 family RecA-like ATPase